jgi:Na+/melibiose symporter-like transporter
MLALASASIGVGVVLALNSGLMPLILKLHTDSAFAIGVVISLGWILGVVLPPIIGAWSDNTRTKFGRRMPYLMIFVPLTALALIGISFFGAHEPGSIVSPKGTTLQFYFVTLLFCLLNFFYNVWNAPYFALYADMTCEKDRGECSGYVQALNILGTVATFMVGAAVWDQYPIMTFVILALVVATSSAITIFTIKEPTEHMSKPPEKTHLAEIFREFMQAKEFAKFMYASAFWWFAMGVISPFFVLFATESLGLDPSSAQLIMGIFTIILVISAIPIGIAGDKIGKKPVLMAGLVLSSASLLATYFISNITLIYVAMGLSGIGFGVVIVLNMALSAELLPKGKEGKFMGIGNIFMALPQALASTAGGAAISALGNNYRIIFIMAPAALILAFFVLRWIKIPNAAEMQKIECATKK